MSTAIACGWVILHSQTLAKSYVIRWISVVVIRGQPWELCHTLSPIAFSIVPTLRYFIAHNAIAHLLALFCTPFIVCKTVAVTSTIHSLIVQHRRGEESFPFLALSRKSFPLGGGRRSFSKRKLFWAQVSLEHFADSLACDFPRWVLLRKLALNFLTSWVHLYSACP